MTARPAGTVWPAGVGRVILAEIDSTNEEARRRATAGETGPIWIMARAQSAGRGRRGRAWTSATGNLFATLLIRPDEAVRTLGQYSFVAALAVADALGDVTGVPERFALKWPNDPLLDGVKLSGILLESASRADGRADWLAVGVGINLSHHPEGTERPATSLRAEGLPVPEPEAALERLAVRFAQWQALRGEQGFGPVRAAWLQRAVGLGGPVTARLTGGDLSGTFVDLDCDGALILKDGEGRLHQIAAGDVFFSGA